MKMKKWMALSCAAAMVLSALPVSADEAEVNEEVSGSITVWEHEYSFEEALKAVIEGFKAKYPNVEVDYEIKASDYQQVLATALQSGEGPDLFWTNGTATDILPGYVANGMVEELTDTVDFSIMTDDAMKLATIDGKQYSVPWLTMDSRACFYNKDIFEENGWEVPKTFSEFEELLAKIKEAGITPISQGYGDWSLLFIWEPVMAAYDPEYTRGLDDYTSKADGPGASGSLQKLVDWANAGYFGENWLGMIGDDDALLGFTTGNAAMMIGGTWNISSIDQNNPDLNYGAFAIPAEDGTTGLVGTAANGFSINANTQNKEAAEAFASYCATKEGQTAWVQAVGGVSASPEIESAHPVAQEISVSGGGNIFRSWQNVVTTYAKTDTADTVWSEDILKVMSGEITVDDMMADVAAIME